MPQIKHTPGALTANKKMMVLSVHRYLQKNMPKRQSSEATTLRKEVALAIGVGEATVARIVAEINKTGEVAPSKQGQRAPKDFQTEYVDIICDQILAGNKSGTPLSLRTLIIELSELGFTVSKA
ncbi:7872_t:CDS:1 [Gigaspora rosea]|nr:7872_t:CDS:1 [Gigaspora rosea]